MKANSLLASGGRVAALAGLALLGVVAAGCGAHVGQLKEAASADLNCPMNRVHVLSSGKTRDVEACGQRATYHWEDGDWRMVARGAPTTTTGAAPAVAPAQPAPVNGQPITAPGTPSMPPSSPPPPPAVPGNKSL
jgi:hypothetical protein